MKSNFNKCIHWRGTEFLCNCGLSRSINKLSLISNKESRWLKISATKLQWNYKKISNDEKILKRWISCRCIFQKLFWKLASLHHRCFLWNFLIVPNRYSKEQPGTVASVMSILLSSANLVNYNFSQLNYQHK